MLSFAWFSTDMITDNGSIQDNFVQFMPLDTDNKEKTNILCILSHK